MKFLLDEDVHPSCATVARGLGLDVVSVHELNRNGISDEEQLGYAASVGRVLVTRNRNDFLVLVNTFYNLQKSFDGVLIVPFSFPNDRPEAMAHALKRWAQRHGPAGAGPGIVDYLS